MPRILVVEDDEFFREAVCDLLTAKGFFVLSAPSGKSAKEIMSMQNFDLVISDIQMPGVSGIELLDWSIQNKPVPFIIMTGFSQLLETRSAYDHGAKEFITKPFKDAELLPLINKVLNIGAPAVVADTNEYGKVSIDEFIARPRAEFDVYIKLSDTKYIKVTHKGDAIESERIQHYKSKGLKYLYILKEDFAKLVDFNLDVAKLIKTRSDISTEKKLNFMKYTGEVILEKAFIAGVDKESFDDAKEFLNLTVNVITDSEEHVDLLSLLNSHADWIYAHSIGVSMYSIMIARKMGFESTQAFYKLSMAGLFHDIGEKEIERAILEKPRQLLTTTERKLIESHVTRGKEILLVVKGITEDIVQIVYEHHEDYAGQGYPNGRVKHGFHPLSAIIQAANLFAEQTLKSPMSEGKTGRDAVLFLEKLYKERIDPKCMIALKALFSVA